MIDEVPTIPVEEQVEQSAQPVVQEVAAKPAESESEKNFRVMRQRMIKVERERDEALQKLQAQTPVIEEDYSINLAPDDLAEGKHLSKVDKKIKKLEAQLNQYQQQSSNTNTEALLKSQYHDFDKIVSVENIQLLKEQYPEIAQTLNTSGDLYSKAVSAYTLIKKLGIVPDEQYNADKAKAQANAAKPKPLASVSPQQGDSPLSRANAFANGLTDELQKQLRKEMEQARRNL